MKDFLVSLYQVLLIILIGYISGWLMFIKPIIGIMSCDIITGGMIASLVIKIVFAIPVGKFINALGIRIALKIF